MQHLAMADWTPSAVRSAKDFKSCWRVIRNELKDQDDYTVDWPCCLFSFS